MEIAQAEEGGLWKILQADEANSQTATIWRLAYNKTKSITKELEKLQAGAAAPDVSRSSSSMNSIRYLDRQDRCRRQVLARHPAPGAIRDRGPGPAQHLEGCGTRMVRVGEPRGRGFKATWH